MKRRIVTSFDQRFYLSPDDFFKRFAISKGMRKVVEIIGHIELVAISPTGYSRQFVEENLLPDAPMSRKWFTDGEGVNASLRTMLETATMIVCKVEPLRYPKESAASLRCEFRRDSKMIGYIGFIFAEDGTEEVCAAHTGIEEDVADEVAA